MKLAELDWRQVLGTLPRWDALSPSARRAFLEMRTNKTSSPEELGASLGELREAGFAAIPGGGRLLSPAPEVTLLLRALRAARRHRLLEDRSPNAAIVYLQDQTTHDETHALLGRLGTFSPWSSREAAAVTVSDPEWVGDFMAAAGEGAAALSRWETARKLPADPRLLAFSGVAAALHGLVRSLTTRAEGVPLGGLAALLPAADEATRAAALAAGLRYFLLFLGLSRDARLVVGLHPGVVHAMAPPPPPPPPVEAGEGFEGAFRAGDMTTVLVEAATAPIPVRSSDNGLYARSQRALGERLAWLPDWLAAHVDAPPVAFREVGPLEMRIEAALAMLKLLKMVDQRYGDQSLELYPTRRGKAWMAGSEGERVRALLDAFRALPQRNPISPYWGREGLDFFGAYLRDVPESLDLRAALSEAFLSIPPGVLVSLEEFLEHQTRARNPFFTPAAQAGPRRGGTPPSRLALELAWSDLLRAFLVGRLLPFGGARVAPLCGDALAFGVTDAGRYLLGGTEEFAYAPAAEGDVLVQPDFEVVFLGPAPGKEAEVGRIAERIGAGVGALFRVTRASVLRAAEQGLTGDAMLEILAGAARAGVPDNVSRQVRDWVGATRRIRLSPTTLIECPDAETAARVQALGGKDVRAVTSTILRIDLVGKARNAFVKKLREKGLFVGD